MGALLVTRAGGPSVTSHCSTTQQPSTPGRVPSINHGLPHVSSAIWRPSVWTMGTDFHLLVLPWWAMVATQFGLHRMLNAPAQNISSPKQALLFPPPFEEAPFEETSSHRPTSAFLCRETQGLGNQTFLLQRGKDLSYPPLLAFLLPRASCSSFPAKRSSVVYVMEKHPLPSSPQMANSLVSATTKHTNKSSRYDLLTYSKWCLA